MELIVLFVMAPILLILLLWLTLWCFYSRLIRSSYESPPQRIYYLPTEPFVIDTEPFPPRNTGRCVPRELDEGIYPDLSLEMGQIVLDNGPSVPKFPGAALTRPDLLA